MRRLALSLTLAWLSLVLLAPSASQAGLIVTDFGLNASGNITSTSFGSVFPFRAVGRQSTVIQGAGKNQALPGRAGITNFSLGGPLQLRVLDVTIFGSLNFANMGPALGNFDGVSNFVLTSPLNYNLTGPVDCRGALCAAVGGVLGQDFPGTIFKRSALPPFNFAVNNVNSGASFLFNLPFTFLNGEFRGTLNVSGSELARTFQAAAPAQPAQPVVPEPSLMALLGLGLACLAGVRLRHSS